MSDDRTEDQVAADKALEEAIQQVVFAYSIAPPGGFMLNNYVVAGNGRVFNEDGEYRNYFSILKDGGTDFNWDEGLGMLRRVHHELTDMYMEDGKPF